ncbi:MAG: SGNH/GDSL hydrolase family protein [Planctomycetota bacterium]|nr:SGNH/GDSL hydrolase family protein [Planctomycetota bacterium]
MSKVLPWVTLSLLLGTPLAAQQPQLRYAVPAPGPLADCFGTNVQRTMTLLATSTPQQRNHVRILVYGQSISDGIWWRHVERELRTRFPNAALEMVNRALGGHASNYLVREAETDVYPFYPDLVIFHVYGAHTCYEQIISRIRSRTAAEVLMTTDHLGAAEVPDDRGEFHDDRWTKFMASFIPQVAERYGCELVDVRDPWKRYVLDHKVPAKGLLVDGIHLGEQGNLLYAALICRQLVYRPELKSAPDPVRTYEVGRDVQWKDGKLALEFEGNRIDAVAGPGDESPAGAAVLLDDKKPSEFRECYAFTRAYGPGLKVLCVFSEKTPLVEDWTLRVTGVDPVNKSFSFEAIGSKTGPDGSGSSAKRFVSKSERIVIETEVEKPAMRFESDWSFDIQQVKPGAEVKFQCYALSADRYVAPTIKDPSLEPAVMLAQGIANGKHRVVLTADDPAKVRLKALRVYRPSAPAPTKMVYDVVHPGK